MGTEPKSCLYHYVKKDEGFEKAARDIYELVAFSIKRAPDRPRALFIDIDGHRTGDPENPFDEDMFQLFMWILRELRPYLTEFNTPMFEAENPEDQSNDLPPLVEPSRN